MTDPRTKQTEERDVTKLIGVTSAKLEELEQYYDSWSATYEQDLTSMGYDAPQVAAKAIENHGIDPSQPILDAGCGVGLTGLHLGERGYRSIVGLDYSGKSLERSGERGCYSELKRADLNDPLEFPDDHFGAAQCIGTLTYVENMAGLMREFHRVVKPGGIVQLSHRVDLYDDGYRKALSDLTEKGLWTHVHHSDPHPYIPGHQDFGDDQAIIFDIFRVN
ncbi:class I SAM-dependent DNA methyltransferase [Imhoffiella purpurea]|uniref:Ubiquinone/menaquinone biosynthesis methyl transferase n=1 Tax=Imhoffiella purpurea TaxID=1249627 RepID=W9V9F1_9GAMM|nr:class I SAM-dependent methyltransferase [Imhoffiella purpurea]EXJ16074.1 ubiquinone/menaquinone biosynthesis methyl transferase [Imhoffiella purpurea]